MVRALLAKGRTYEKAVETFQPYDCIRDANERAREAMTDIARRIIARKYEACLFVNSRLEGFAPGTFEEVVERLLI